MYLRLRICWGPLVGTGNPSRNCTNGTLVCGRRQTCLLVVSAAAHHIPQHAPLWQGIRMAQVEPAAPRWLHPYPRENRARAVTRRVKISSRVATCMRRCRSAAPAFLLERFDKAGIRTIRQSMSVGWSIGDYTARAVGTFRADNA